LDLIERYCVHGNTSRYIHIKIYQIPVPVPIPVSLPEGRHLTSPANAHVEVANLGIG